MKGNLVPLPRLACDWFIATFGMGLHSDKLMRRGPLVGKTYEAV